MSKLASRLLIFFIGLPIVLGIVYLPYYNHLALHILLSFVSMICAMEMHNLLSKRVAVQNKALVVSLATLVTVTASLTFVIPSFFPNIKLPFEVIEYVFAITLLVVLAKEIFSGDDFSKSIEKIISSAFNILYSGYLVTFVSKIAVKYQLVFTLLLIVFMCDSLAWFFGILLGKSNRGIFKASPNKSVAGFIGGLIGAVAGAVISKLIWPEILGDNYIFIAILCVICWLTSVTGDLAESVIKRSAGEKDSGHIIPGRGGILDSIDSIIMTAPFFFIVLSLLFPEALNVPVTLPL